MGSFENNVVNLLDRRDVNEREHPVIKRMHPKAVKILSDAAFKPEDFKHHFSPESIEADLRELKARKESFAEENGIKHIADVFEALVFQHAELSNWLGQNAETIRTSEYDDVVNGVDLIVEFTDEGTSKHLALGVDVTFGTRSINRKFLHIKHEIERDRLADVKYFEAHNHTGSLKQLPRVVIGVEMDTVIALAALWMNDRKKELSEHFVRDILVQEVTLQLKKFLEYAEAIGSTKATRSYREAITTIKNVNLNTTPTHDAESKKSIANDKVFRNIKQELESFTKAKTLPD